MSKRLTTTQGSLQVDCTLLLLQVALTYYTLSDLKYYDKVFFLSLAKGLGYSVICRITVWMMQSTLISIARRAFTIIHMTYVKVITIYDKVTV